MVYNHWKKDGTELSCSKSSKYLRDSHPYCLTGSSPSATVPLLEVTKQKSRSSLNSRRFFFLERVVNR